MGSPFQNILGAFQANRDRQRAQGERFLADQEIEKLSSPNLTEDERTASLLMLSKFNAPLAKFAEEVRTRGDMRQRVAMRDEAEEGLRNALTLKNLPDHKARVNFLGELSNQAILDNKPVDGFMGMMDMTPDELEVQIIKDEIQGIELSKLSALTEVGRPQGFSDVLNDKGEIVAQMRPDGKVVKSPLAVGGGENLKNTFSKGSSFLVKSPDGSTSLATPVLDSRTGDIELKTNKAKGQIVDRSFGETGREKSGRLVEQAGKTETVVLEAQAEGIGAVERAKVRNKSLSQRSQKRIERGIEAASSLPVLNRGLQLLEGVKTGGFDNAKLRAKQLFGIESADEAELSNSLGKAVLAQLRSTFGAAFTAQEGASLARIEAGFGKSTKGNIRLLKQARKIALDAAKRGLRQARSEGDAETVQEIQDFIDFNLDPAKDEDLGKVSTEDLLKRFGQ